MMPDACWNSAPYVVYAWLFERGDRDSTTAAEAETEVETEAGSATVATIELVFNNDSKGEVMIPVP